MERSVTPDYWCDVILRTQNGWQNKSHVSAFILSLLRSSEKQNRTLYRGSATLHTLSVFYQPFGLSLQYAFLILFHVSQALDSLRNDIQVLSRFCLFLPFWRLSNQFPPSRANEGAEERLNVSLSRNEGRAVPYSTEERGRGEGQL